MPPQRILDAYRRERQDPHFDLARFVDAHFKVQQLVAHDYRAERDVPLARHIDALWSVLERHPAEHPGRGSLLPLPHDYVVPGGRFAELYYWDSYFTMLGFAPGGRPHLLRAMTDNFADLIDRFGRVPNGTRTYYLSRSQPPVFALMVELLEAQEPGCGQRYLGALRQEHAFWMDGEHTARAGEAVRRVVALRDGALLNRYWDDRDSPREESWREDVATARSTSRPQCEVWRDLRAACESGWDFSSRWLDEDTETPDLHTLRTTAIVPVDLNALLWQLEKTIARLSADADDRPGQQEFERRASGRADALRRIAFDAQAGAFFDYDWQRDTRRRGLTAATVAPLFVGLATRDEAAAVAATTQRRLLAPGGFATTERHTGQQWDRPNGWAPLQWMAVRGFARCGQQALAHDIRARWLKSVKVVYRREHRLVEKYALRETPAQHTRGGGGGEYPLQDGFGWTNGVTRCWLDDPPTSGGPTIA